MSLVPAPELRVTIVRRSSVFYTNNTHAGGCCVYYFLSWV
jgi:hypothetical protein